MSKLKLIVDHARSPYAAIADAAEAKLKLEMEAERDAHDLDWAIRDLFANLLRVAAGGGRSYEINNQCVAVCNAMQVVFQHEKCREYFAPISWRRTVERALHSWTNETQFMAVFKQLSHSAKLQHYAENNIVNGALRIVASQVLGQMTQRAHGETDMYTGIRDLEVAQEEVRRELEVRR